MNQQPGHRLFAAIYDPVTQIFEPSLLKPHREYLTEHIDGVILDLGAGTGALFPYFEHVGTESVTHVNALEPDPFMQSRATARANNASVPITLHTGVAEYLPFADDSFDFVLSAMVFCTIQNVAHAIQEITRVLRPGGEFRFFEHVKADGLQQVIQTVFEPCWCRIAGGCHLTRDTATIFRNSDLDVIEFEQLSIGVTPVKPFIRGRLINQ